MIIEFPRHRLATSFKDKEASSASISARNPLARATRVSRSDFQRSEGIESRCHHLLTAADDAPISEAISSLEGHKSITSRKDAGRTAMPNLLGQLVPKSKAKMSRADQIIFSEYPSAMDRMSETEEKAFFIGRVRAARTARYESQEEICRLLEIPQGTYKQYETRSYLPHRLIPKFCIACGVDMNWLLTGIGKGPRREEYIKYVPKLKSRRVAKTARSKVA